MDYRIHSFVIIIWINKQFIAKWQQSGSFRFLAIHPVRISPVHCLIPRCSFPFISLDLVQGWKQASCNSFHPPHFFHSFSFSVFDLQPRVSSSLPPNPEKGAQPRGPFSIAGGRSSRDTKRSGLFFTSTSIYINSSKARVVECGTVNEWRSKGTVPGPAAPKEVLHPIWTSRELETENTGGVALEVVSFSFRARGDRVRLEREGMNKWIYIRWMEGNSWPGTAAFGERTKSNLRERIENWENVYSRPYLSRGYCKFLPSSDI